ncbi:hypothetical protein HMPREF0044_0274 [Gleimia coleocanis DSM 15436]|uniref:DUF4244 domain-containing protein n=1 Tax=Gleimia coleocanis DSM 15436 TaxID=525245 RepID=C0VYN4_9ACTO|nr:DUF4244 domain-containing protein [Gleimia coleocanis]EEH64537.1 hypothetical protein HMPREF0044_0274 [Gleimia coleocanis DSM 15436]
MRTTVKQLAESSLKLRRLSLETADEEEYMGEAGLVTAEYAVGIVTAVAFAGLLLAIIKSDSVRQILFGIIQNALSVAG